MKLLIASDIHGSLYYAKKLADVYAGSGADRLVLLGDLLYHGPRNGLPRGYDPKGVFALLNQMKNSILCVRGNCDADVDQMVLDFPITPESMLLYVDGQVVFATHGHIWGEDNPPPLGKKDILLNGHTHVPAARDTGSFIYLNPGSAALPKEGGRHSYMVYENRRFSVISFDGETVCEYSF
jgi:putative phosphoesterase